MSSKVNKCEKLIYYYEIIHAVLCLLMAEALSDGDLKYIFTRVTNGF